jgi:hypothetical protein
MNEKDPSAWANLPVRVVGNALVTLDRAEQLRTKLIDSWVPEPLAEKLKDPIPELGDTLFGLARCELEGLNELYKYGQRMIRRYTKGGAPPFQTPHPVVVLKGRADQKGPIVEKVSFLNWLPDGVLPRVHAEPFTSRAGIATKVVPSFAFTPEVTIPSGKSCELTVAVRIDDSLKGGQWFFSEALVLGNGEELARVTIQLRLEDEERENEERKR